MRVRLSLIAVYFLGLVLAAQSGADLQRIDDMRDWLKAIEPQLTPTGVTNARNIATRLNTLKGQFVTGAPAPVDCVLSDWTLASSDPWSACVNGTQTRDETWTRTIVTHPANGGAACGPLSETRTATQACSVTPPPPSEVCGNGIDDDGDGQIDEGCSTPPPPPGTHGYFDLLAAHPDVLATYSLRDSKQLQTRANGGFAYCNACALDVTYDAQADAAKVVVGTGSNSLRNQLRLPIQAYGSSLFVTWDVWWGDEFRYAVSGIPTYKAFQFASPADRIWTEVRSRFSQASVGNIARVDVRYYGTSFGPGSGWDWTMSGKWAGSADAIGPQTGEFNIAPQTWTRYFAHFELDPSGFWAFSLWMADATRGPVNLLDRRLIKPNGTSRWESFWLEFNTSTSAVKAGRPPLVGYVRNVVMLKGISDPTPLLIRP